MEENEDNTGYLHTKQQKLGHMLHFSDTADSKSN
jgi:3,4-dihydroxy 2-butanone 4-phosphate synthase/GTP cyclohydrolase II